MKRWFEDIRLYDVALNAGVSVPTVVRHFGGKDGLLSASKSKLIKLVLGEQGLVRNPSKAISVIFSQNSMHSALMKRLIAQESLLPIREIIQELRRARRQFLKRAFTRLLAKLSNQNRQFALDMLTATLDAVIFLESQANAKRDRDLLITTLTRMCFAIFEPSMPRLKLSS